MTIQLDFSRCKAQSRAFRELTTKKRVCNAWGRGTGKSWFARMSLYLDVAKYDGVERPTIGGGKIRGIRQVLLMPTIAQFKKVHAAAIDAELSPGGPWGALGASINHTDWRIEFPGGSWIQLVSAQNASGGLGIRCDKVVADECDDIDISEYERVCIPWFSEPWSLDMRLLSGTPRRGRYGLLWRAFSVWPNGDAEHEPVQNHVGIHATYRDAPSYVSQDMVAEAKRTMSPDTFAREWECDFDSGEGLVYPFFDRAFHVRPPPAMYAFREFIVGFDYGWNDPSVFLVLGIAGFGRDTICHVLREVYVTQKSDTELADIAESIEASFPHARWYSDHHPATIAAFKGRHIDVAMADKTYKVEFGVAFVADAIFIRESEDKRWSQFYVDPSCKRFIEEMGLYRRKRDPRNKDRILDDIDTSANDHGPDAARYALVTRFSGPDRRLILG